MQTALLPALRATSAGQEAERILRTCVHCGFCTATCPTYQLLGDELDGPRGRIYQIKQVLEGHAPSRITQLHLDRCLLCRSCETTCPSGVQYGRLLEIGRELVDAQVSRPWRDRLVRQLLLHFIPHPGRVAALMRLANRLRFLLPNALARRIPRPQPAALPVLAGERTLVLLEGCVQAAFCPETNAAAGRVFGRLGIGLRAVPGCCGAAAYHLGDREGGLATVRRNIDAWWPLLEGGAEGILINASGCGAFVKTYGTLLRGDPHYEEKAQKIAALARDPGEVLQQADLRSLGKPGQGCTIAFQSPCSLQHGQQLSGLVESLLTRLGFQLTPVPDAHLCCGSGGTYALLQPKLADQLRRRKLQALSQGKPDWIATANIGCQHHLGEKAPVPVLHWLELLDRRLRQT